MNKYALVLGSLLVGSAVAACGSSGGSVPTPTAPPACVLPSPLAMVYPAPGSTVAGSSVTQIIIATQTTIPTNLNAILGVGGNVAASGSAFGTATPPFPQPTTAPTFASPVYASSPFSWSPLPPSGSTVELFLNDPNNPNCSPADTGFNFKLQ